MSIPHGENLLYKAMSDTWDYCRRGINIFAVSGMFWAIWAIITHETLWASIIRGVAVATLAFLGSGGLVFFVMLYKESLLNAEAKSTHRNVNSK